MRKSKIRYISVSCGGSDEPIVYGPYSDRAKAEAHLEENGWSNRGNYWRLQISGKEEIFSDHRIADIIPTPYMTKGKLPKIEK